MDYEMHDGVFDPYCHSCGASKIPLREGHDYDQWQCELCDRTNKGQNVNINAALNVAIEIIVRRLKEEEK